MDNVNSRNEEYVINKTDMTYTAPFDRVNEESGSEFERSDDEDVAGLNLFM